jgi:hypothetical protein
VAPPGVPGAAWRHPSRRQAWLAGAARTVHDPGMAQPRETRRIAKPVKRAPKVVAARARAYGGPSHWPTTQANRGSKQGATPRAQRAVPRVAVPSEHHARHGWRPVGSWRPNHVARNALPAVNAQERASTMPSLYRAKTVACGVVKWGKCVWRMVGHAGTRGGKTSGSSLG